jgi:multiple sugar transport system permease protein/raffinose/stachyose/melibiose transport system permease protein
MKTLTVGIATLKAQVVSNWGLIMAANTASLVPIIIVFLFLQRYFMEGLTAGCLKG